MPIQKQSLNNFLPDGFETLNQEGYKENFSEDKIKTGYEKDIKDRVSGPNFNNLIDVIGKNTNVLSNFLEFIKSMPINSILKINNNNEIDYQEIGDIDNKVSKSGDTMTGNLVVNKEQGYFAIKSPSLDNTTAPSSSIISAFRQTDKNNKIMGDVRFQKDANGTQSTYILARNAMTGEEKSTSLGVHVDKDGSLYATTVNPLRYENNNHIATTSYTNEFLRQYAIQGILELPNRIKYTLINGVLTIEKGSVFIVPYGTTDKTSSFPKGANFINSNFKVYDTQFISNKFYVWVELQKDIVRGAQDNTSFQNWHVYINISTTATNARKRSETGTATTTTEDTIYLNTSTNLVGGVVAGSTSINYSEVLTLPIMLAHANGIHLMGTVDAVFDGCGYMGQAGAIQYWYDKDISIIGSFGKNPDGTNSYKQHKTNKILMKSLTSTSTMTGSVVLDSAGGGSINIISEGDTLPIPSDRKSAWFLHLPSNRMYEWNATENAWLLKTQALVKLVDIKIVAGSIIEWKPRKVLRFADYSEINTKSIDGQWIRKRIKLAEFMEIPNTNTAEASFEFDLSSYLPKDHYNYEVTVSIDVETGTASGSFVNGSLFSDGTLNGALIYVRAFKVATRTNSQMYSSTNAIVPVGLSRKINLRYSSGTRAGKLNAMFIEGYRRIGTNE